MEFLKDFLTKEVIWFILGLLMILSEFMIPGLIIIFFGAGAWIVALFCYIFNIGINWQLLIFIVTSVVLLLTLRNKLKAIFYGKVDAIQKGGENLEDFVGKKVMVTKSIKTGLKGSVELNGANWSAEADVEIAEGQQVVITGKDSITLLVKPIEN